mmetsp:Transcript_19498/g.47806  ORF Transcript_19498/g.47806 Transcript_19498/m.47806 type:complete len:169 (+) Transcript_19498:831-1337(+)
MQGHVWQCLANRASGLDCKANFLLLCLCYEMEHAGHLVTEQAWDLDQEKIKEFEVSFGELCPRALATARRIQRHKLRTRVWGLGLDLETLAEKASAAVGDSPRQRAVPGSRTPLSPLETPQVLQALEKYLDWLIQLDLIFFDVAAAKRAVSDAGRLEDCKVQMCIERA